MTIAALQLEDESRRTEIRTRRDVLHMVEHLGATAMGAFQLLYNRLWDTYGNRIVNNDEVLASIAQLTVGAWRKLRQRFEALPGVLAIDRLGRLYMPCLVKSELLRNVRRRAAKIGGHAKALADMLRAQDPADRDELAAARAARIRAEERNAEARRLYRLALEQYKRLDPDWVPGDPVLLDEPREDLADPAMEDPDPDASIDRMAVRLEGLCKRYRCPHRFGMVDQADLAQLTLLQHRGGLRFGHMLLALLVPSLISTPPPPLPPDEICEIV